MGNVSISLDPAGQGWVNLTLSIGSHSFVLDGLSDTTDVFGDLVRAAVHIAAGGFDAQARFDCEPVELRLMLERRWEGVPQQQVFRVRVFEFADYYADSPLETGEELFCVACDPVAFAGAVRLAAARLLADVDAEGHLDWWGLPFPFRAFSALEAALAERRPEVR
ncbi:hypothetical protein ACO2Q0_17240 [Phenylobacterium sp. VNQ135]|uniref:hypothetical protein n=1 Tax=Phenylobacterium sp. VNQ135 TaxID=3400922 RepID=UPI003C00B5DA